VEEEILRTISRAPTPHPEPARCSAGKINLSSLHHRVMRSKGYVPDVSLDQLVGEVRKRILQQADRLMFEYQAQSRERRKWRGYREPEDDGLLKRPKKVRFNPCSTEGRNRKKRSPNYGVDELVGQVNVSFLLLLIHVTRWSDFVLSAHSTNRIELAGCCGLNLVH